MRSETAVHARSAALLAPSPTLGRALAVTAFALLTALSAQAEVLIPGTPVPFTFQTLAVLLAGALLGARLGAASQTAYLLAGAAGLPVFAGGAAGAAHLFGPSGGYLLAAPAAALVAGALVARSRGLVTTVLALLAGLATMYAGGVAWLSVLGGMTMAVALGLKPFLAADLVKVGVAGAVVRRLGKRARPLAGEG